MIPTAALVLSSSTNMKREKPNMITPPAIENQKLGKEIKPEKKGKSVDIPSELNVAFEGNHVLRDAFQQLTPGKQREYAEYIDTAKREDTKLSRIEKITPMIIKGVGLHDKYKNC